MAKLRSSECTGNDSSSCIGIDYGLHDWIGKI